MKILWIIAVVLGLVYLAIWAGMRSGDDAATPRPSPTPDLKTTLSEKAQGDAIGRVPSNATVKIVSVSPQFFTGPELTPSSPTVDSAIPGFVITVQADVDGKPQSKLVYHGAPPQQIVFVRQEAP